jgi:hypothetical protein
VFAVLLWDFQIWLYNNSNASDDALIQFSVLAVEKMLDIIPHDSLTTCYIFLMGS